MCEFCETTDGSRESEGIIQRENGAFDLYALACADDYGGITNINFCPKCGRKIN